MHFEHGHDYRRAVKYLLQAARNHSLRYANREAIAYLSRALKLVELRPESERAEERIATLEQAGLARIAMGEMAGAADDFASLADYAREQGRMEDESARARLLGLLASALSRLGQRACRGAQ
jgi:hypothetical protein